MERIYIIHSIRRQSPRRSSIFPRCDDKPPHKRERWPSHTHTHTHPCATRRQQLARRPPPPPPFYAGASLEGVDFVGGVAYARTHTIRGGGGEKTALSATAKNPFSALYASPHFHLRQIDAIESSLSLSLSPWKTFSATCGSLACLFFLYYTYFIFSSRCVTVLLLLLSCKTVTLIFGLISICLFFFFLKKLKLSLKEVLSSWTNNVKQLDRCM